MIVPVLPIFFHTGYLSAVFLLVFVISILFLLIRRGKR